MMRIGVFYFPTDYGADIRELAPAVEERGFESLFLPEHTHIPKSRRTPFPGGGDLPKAYSHTHDPFVALSFAAAATKRILLGTGICLIPQRDPIVTAKCVASLDRLSNGRYVKWLPRLGETSRRFRLAYSAPRPTRRRLLNTVTPVSTEQSWRFLT